MAISHHFLRLPQTQLEHALLEPADLDDTINEVWESDTLHLEIERSWQLIHFLLVGTAWGRQGRLARAVLGGEEIPGSDSGQGPCRYNKAKDVRLLMSELDSLRFEALWSRFDLAHVQAAQIYPEDWTAEDGDRRQCRQDYESLCAFLRLAAADNEAVVMFLS